ncbi:MAG: anthranilate phosphoribosyltransferase [Candidatus Binatia bacterium]
MNTRDAIARLLEGRDLSEAEASEVVGEVMDGGATPAQIGALLVLLRKKGETVDELTGAARAMRDKVTRVRCERPAVLDTCGTGGDGGGTFNISTAAGLVAAAAGCTVAKHGNRAMSGAVGGADVLERLGVRIDLEPADTEALLAETRFAFLFAPLLHGAMRHAAGPRRELGVRTMFNLLGPLTNPAGARHHLLGVFDRVWVEPVAEVLRRLGSVHALVVHGDDGLDEITTTATTEVAELRGGTVRRLRLAPEELGLARARPEDLRIGGAAESAELIGRILGGETGPPRDVVLLNAGAAIYAADLVSSIAAGIERARQAIDDGSARALLDRVARASRRPASADSEPA